MILGKVIGAVWGAKEARLLDGMKLLEVRPVRLRGGVGVQEIGADLPDPDLGTETVVAVDMLGAGIGEYVLVGHGSRIRDLTVGRAVPAKDIVLAIVDRAAVELDLVNTGDGRR
ncbi:MAG: EutN/CcmL family microcompartment protein [Pseudomonadota bacterium]